MFICVILLHWIANLAHGQVQCPAPNGAVVTYAPSTNKCYAISNTAGLFNSGPSICATALPGSRPAAFLTEAESIEVVNNGCAGLGTNEDFHIDLRCVSCNSGSFGSSSRFVTANVAATVFTSNMAAYKSSSTCFNDENYECITVFYKSSTNSGRAKLCNSYCQTAPQGNRKFCCEATPIPSVTPTQTASETVTPSRTETSTSTPSNTPSISLSETPTPSPTETSSNTPSISFSQTPTNSQTVTQTGTPSISFSQTGTSTPSNTRTNTPSISFSQTGTSTPSNTRTGTPSTSFSQTCTKTPTNSRTGTPTNTKSKTGTPSNTPSKTGTPSNTPSKTGTPSNTASRTGTPSNSGTMSPTRTPTRSGTPTRTATRSRTGSITPSRTRTSSITPSRTPTGSSTPSRTPTGSGTPTFTMTGTGSPSRTPSVTGTLSGTATRTSTATVSGTRTGTGTNTGTGTGTGTMTGTRTGTGTGTPTATLTPSATPWPLHVAHVHQQILNEHFGLIALSGTGFKPRPDSTYLLVPTNFAHAGYVAYNNTYAEAICPLDALLWSHSHIQLIVNDLPISFTKPASFQDVAALSASSFAYGDVMEISAPLLAMQNNTRITMLDNPSSTAPSFCDVIGSTAPNNVTCRLMHILDSHFNRPLWLYATRPGNIMHVALNVAITIARPTVANVGRTTTVHESLRYPYYVHPWPFAGPAALQASAGLRGYVRGQATAAGFRDRSAGTFVIHPYADSFNSTLLVANEAMRLSIPSISRVSALPPKLFEATPSSLQWLPSTKGFNISVFGAGLSRLSGLTFPPYTCEMFRNDWTSYECELHAPGTIANRSKLVPSAVGHWQSRFIPGPSLSIYQFPTITRVLPTTIYVGSRIVIFGENFLLATCPTCESLGVPTIRTGGVDCLTPVVLSATVATCIVPPGVAFDDQRRVNITIQHGAIPDSGVANATLTSSLSMEWWFQQIGANESITVLPSGDSAVFPVTPTVAVRVFGYGPATCRIDMVRYSKPPTAVISARLLRNVWNGVLGAGGEESTVVEFSTLGIQLPSNSSMILSASCSNDGSRADITEFGPLHTVSWSLGWLNDSTVLLPPSRLPPFVAVLRVDGNTTTSMLVNAFDCTAAVTRGSDDRRGVRSVLSSASSGLARTEADGIFRLEFASLSASNAELGATYLLKATCVYRPTGELLATDSIVIGIFNASVSWELPGANNNNSEALATLHTPWRLPIRTSLVASTAEEGQYQFECRVVQFTLGGAFLDVSESRLIVTKNTPLPLVVSMDGPRTGSVEARIECSYYDQRIMSPLVRLQHLQLTILPVFDLPGLAALSEMRVPATMQPPVQFRVSQVFNLTTICRLESTNVKFRIRSVQSDPPTLTFGDQSEVLDLFITNADDRAALDPDNANTSVRVSCSLSNGDDLQPLEWLVDIVGYRTMLPTVIPSGKTDANGKIPTFSMGLAPTSSLHLSNETHSALFMSLLDRKLVFCTVMVTDSAAYIQRGQPPITPNGVASFDNTMLLGSRGQTYSMEVTCEVAGLVLSPMLRFSLELLACPRGTQPSGLTCETCPFGTYSVDMNAQPCIQCPSVGVVCSRGLLSMLPNFYRPQSENGQLIGPNSEFHPCYNTFSCITNQSTFSVTCSPGYAGPLCAACDLENEYEMFGKACVKCWPKELSKMLLSIMVIAFVAIVAFIGLRKTDNKRSEPMIVIRIALAYLQALDSLQLMKAGGTALYRDLMGWTQSVGSSPFSVGPVQCLMHMSLPMKYLTTLLTPIAAPVTLVMVVSFVTALRACKMRPFPHVSRDKFKEIWRTWLKEQRLTASLIMFMTLSYMPIVGASFNLMGCYDKPIAGVYYMTATTRIECNSVSHNALRFTGMAVLIAFGLGLPAWLYRQLSKGTHRVNDEKFHKAFGFLYDGYRVNAVADTEKKSSKIGSTGNLVWWESVVLIRKSCVVALATIVTNPFNQVVGAMICFSFFMILQQHFKPYTNKFFNMLEFITLGSLFLVASTSGVLLRSLDAEGTLSQISSSGATLVTALLMMLTIATIAVLGFAFISFAFKRVGQLKIFKRFRSDDTETPQPDGATAVTPTEDTKVAVEQKWHTNRLYKGREGSIGCDSDGANEPAKEPEPHSPPAVPGKLSIDAQNALMKSMQAIPYKPKSIKSKRSMRAKSRNNVKTTSDDPVAFAGDRSPSPPSDEETATSPNPIRTAGSPPSIRVAPAATAAIHNLPPPPTMANIASMQKMPVATFLPPPPSQRSALPGPPTPGSTSKLAVPSMLPPPPSGVTINNVMLASPTSLPPPPSPFTPGGKLTLPAAPGTGATSSPLSLLPPPPVNASFTPPNLPPPPMSTSTMPLLPPPPSPFTRAPATIPAANPRASSPTGFSVPVPGAVEDDGNASVSPAEEEGARRPKGAGRKRYNKSRRGTGAAGQERSE